MKDLKLAFKLLPYAYQAKMNLGASAVMFFVFTILFWFFLTEERASGGLSIGYAAYFVLLAGMFPAQSLVCYTIAHFSATSPKQKRLQVSIPVKLNCLFMTVGYLTILIQGLIAVGIGKAEKESVAQMLFCAGLYGMIFSIYMSASTKKYLLSTILFVFVIVPLLIFELFITLPLWASTVLGEGMILLGAVIARLLCGLLYKTSVSKRIESLWLKRLDG